MKNKKGFALIISLVLLVSMALPGTLAVSTDQEAAASDLTIAEITPAPEATDPSAPETTETPVPGTTETPVPGTTETPAPGTTENPAPEATATPAPSETEKPAETEAPCTCGSTDGVHAEGCPLYEAPETLMAAPAPVEDTATNTLMIQITDSTTDEQPYVLVDVTDPDEYSKRVVVQVNGSETFICGLQRGTYTCAVVTGWSWQCDKIESAELTIDTQEIGCFEFSITKKSSQWLDGDAYCKNGFKNN